MLYADFFLDQANRELDKHVVGFDPEAEKLLVACDWPGNLRQLKNAVTRAVLLTTGEYVTPAELPAELSEAVPAPIALRDPAGEEERIRRVWKYSTSFWEFPHRSTAAYKIINFLYL